MAILIPLGMFALLMAVISAAGYRYYARPGRVFDQVGSAGAGIESIRMPDLYESAGENQGVAGLVRRVGEKMPVSPRELRHTQWLLTAAGYRSASSPWILFGLKAISAVVFVIVSGYLRTSVAPTFMLQTLFVILSGAAGYFAPSWILDLQLAKRQERLKLALPDALDLMVVCVEAGLALDQTVLKVARELRIAHPDLADELSLVTLEMQAGSRRMDAMRGFAERTGVNEIRKLVAILVQTDRFGTSMGDALKTHSEFMRIRRRQEAEERANKIGVKLVFPIFFCILPAMLLVVAGPGILQMLKYLFPMMQQFKG